MKDLLGIVSNVTASWKTTAVGALFILIFVYDYVTATVPIEMVSIDTAILALGISLMFVPDKKESNKKEKE